MYTCTWKLHLYVSKITLGGCGENRGVLDRTFRKCSTFYLRHGEFWEWCHPLWVRTLPGWSLICTAAIDCLPPFLPPSLPPFLSFYVFTFRPSLCLPFPVFLTHTSKSYPCSPQRVNCTMWKPYCRFGVRRFSRPCLVSSSVPATAAGGLELHD